MPSLVCRNCAGMWRPCLPSKSTLPLDQSPHSELSPQPSTAVSFVLPEKSGSDEETRNDKRLKRCLPAKRQDPNFHVHTMSCTLFDPL